MYLFLGISLALRIFTGGFAISAVENAYAENVAVAEKPQMTDEDDRRLRSQRLLAITGDSEFADERSAWDKTYDRKDYVYGKEPVSFLVQHVSDLPKGRALDIATGEGRNAVYLAKKGFQVEGVDISFEGIRKAQKLAAENGVKLKTLNADLNTYRIPQNSFSVILNFYYLQRSLFPQIVAGLKKGGILVFETHTVDQLKNPSGKNFEKEYLLEKGELKKAFSGLEIISYTETNDGRNAIASLMARKR
jgi:SAM-dependent methyltransferase